MASNLSDAQLAAAGCGRPECQTTAGCAHRGPNGEYCYFGPADWPRPVSHLPVYQLTGCICPPTSEQTCMNPNCPRRDPKTSIHAL